MIDVRKYSGEQVIITSERLIFNTRKDDIIISTKKDIVLTSSGAIHVNVGPKSGAKPENNFYIINTPKFQVGLNNAEAVVKGDKAVDVFNKILNALAELAQNLSTATGVGVGTVSEPSINAAGAQLQGRIKNINNLVEEIKSKVSFTA